MEENIKYNLNKIMEEIQNCYDNKLYYAALELLLTLPDICGKIEWENKRVKDRYNSWCNEWLKGYFANIYPLIDTDNIWFESLYDQRCSIVHTAQKCNEILSNEFINLTKFEFYVNESDETDCYLGGASYTGEFRKNNTNFSTIKISIKYLMTIMFNAVSNFINNNEKIKDYNFLEINIGV